MPFSMGNRMSNNFGGNGYNNRYAENGYGKQNGFSNQPSRLGFGFGFNRQNGNQRSNAEAQSGNPSQWPGTNHRADSGNHAGNPSPWQQPPRQQYQQQQQQFGMSTQPNMYGQQMPMQQLPQYPATQPNSGFGGQQPARHPATTEQLQSINQGLPDGVTYQPIDMNNLPKPTALMPTASMPAASIPSSHMPASSMPSASIPSNTAASSPMPALQPAPPLLEVNPYAYMEKLIQNEKNGADYYMYLSNISPTAEMRDIVFDISGACGKCKDAFTVFYANKTAKPFFPAEVEINKQASFRDGVIFAIKEESKSLRELSDIYAYAAEEPVQRFINSQMHKKLADLSLLHMILSST